MKLRVMLAATAALMIGASVAHADQTINVTFQVTLDSEYDLVTSKYEPLSVPSVFNFSASIPETVKVTGYDTTIVSQFGSTTGTTIDNPLLAAVPAGEGGSQALPYQQASYTILASDDDPSTYVEEFGIISSSDVPQRNGEAYTDTQLRINKYSSSRGGTGSGAQDYGTSDVLTLLRGVEANPAGYYTYFYEEYGNFTYLYPLGASYQDGQDFSGTVKVLSVSAAPEPSTWALMLMGVGGIGMALRRRRSSTVLGSARTLAG